jgi:hypothetical protein
MKGIFEKLKGQFSRSDGISLELENGDRILLVKMSNASESTPKEIVRRNLFRVNPQDVIVWQVGEYPHCLASTFTNIYWGEAGELLAFNFDCGEYVIELDTGKPIGSRFLR